MVSFEMYHLQISRTPPYSSWLHKSHLCNNIGTLPAKERLMEHLELESELSHVIGDPEAIGQCGEPVLDVLVCISYQSLRGLEIH